MTIQQDAPEISPGYPYKRRVFPAWQRAWDIMRYRGQAFMDGTQLAATAVEGSSLAIGTMQAVLTRAANAGLLERETREVRIQVRIPGGSEFGRLVQSSRKRTFYRIKAQS